MAQQLIPLLMHCQCCNSLDYFCFIHGLTILHGHGYYTWTQYTSYVEEGDAGLPVFTLTTVHCCTKPAHFNHVQHEIGGKPREGLTC